MKTITLLLLSSLLLASCASSASNSSKKAEDNQKLEEGFLTEVQTLSVSKFSINDESESTALSTFPFEEDVLNSLCAISTETEPYVEVSCFKESDIQVIGKILVADNYLLLVKASGYMEYQSICAVNISSSNTIGKSYVVANYSGGTGASQELKSNLQNNKLNMLVINKSWDMSGFAHEDTTLYSCTIQALEKGLSFNFN